ncbi:MAG: DnaJ domain-containing protein [Candidatus Melainabacteria bacterium]|nr:DnaJ domain-containing protein [Candidatus Melainabacteria bacterium]
MKDYYRILEIAPSASPEILANAYRTLARKFHPDRHQDDRKPEMEQLLKEINEAYRVLSDPNRRRLYDENYQRFLDAQTRSRTSGPFFAEEPARLSPWVARFRWALGVVLLLAGFVLLIKLTGALFMGASVLLVRIGLPLLLFVLAYQWWIHRRTRVV